MNQELQKAIQVATAAAATLLKSHVEAHKRHSASGAVIQVRAYDDRRRSAVKASDSANKKQAASDIDDPTANRQSAADHTDAALSHIDAMRSAHETGAGNQAINEHFHAASRNLAIAHSLRSFHKDNTGHHAAASTRHAEKLSGQAWDVERDIDGKQPTAESLNHATSIHMLAAEQHHRAAEARMVMAEKHHGTDIGRANMEEANNHRDIARNHGQRVHELNKISTDASNAAHAASNRANISGSAADHRAAAAAHRQAAKLDYDSEGKADHEDSANKHEAMASDAEDKAHNQNIDAGKADGPYHGTAQRSDGRKVRVTIPRNER